MELVDAVSFLSVDIASPECGVQFINTSIVRFHINICSCFRCVLARGSVEMNPVTLRDTRCLLVVIGTLAVHHSKPRSSGAA